MQKIVPHLWFDNKAKEAAEFYVSTFGKDSKITSARTIHNTPSGDADVLSFEIWGYGFESISAGPYFKPNPAISFMVNFDPSQHEDAKDNIDRVWGKLSEGGKVLMEIGEYPFSKRYGWIEDKYGFSWQLILTDPKGEDRPLIMPSLLFVKENCGKTEEATDFYLSVFKGAKRGEMARYPSGMEPDKEGTVMFTDFTLANQWFIAMDSAHEHAFNFTEAVSLIVYVENQEEADYFSNQLSAVPEAEQCGWVKDKYGVSWQIIPTAFKDLMKDPDQAKIDRVVEAMLQMKRLNIAKLQAAAE